MPCISEQVRMSSSLGPGIGLGQRLAQSMVSSMLVTSQTQYPATSSRASAKGLSITVRFAPSKAIRLPADEGLSPSPSIITPAFTSRSEEHTSELQSLMRISYAVFCLKKKTRQTSYDITTI